MLNIHHVVGQTSTLTNNIVDFSNIQESEGTANITIPFHEISIKGYNLPVNINYNSSGVKVDNESSNVGQNWELSAQSVITRNTNIYFDESTEQLRPISKYKYFPVGQNPYGGSYVECIGIKVEPAKGYLSNLNLAKQIYQDYKNFIPPIGVQTSSVPLNRIKYNLVYDSSLGTFTSDVQPDSFTAVIPNKETFKFMFNHDGIIVTNSTENFKISYDKKNTDYIQEFTLIDENGIKYTFASTETYNTDIYTDNAVAYASNQRNTPYTYTGSKLSNLEQNSINSNTPFCVDDSNYPATPQLIAKYRAPKPVSWYLSKIENIYGETINFEYEKTRTLNIPRAGFGAALQNNNNVTIGGAAGTPLTGGHSILLSEVPVIKAISSNHEKLVFEYRKFRQDVISSGNKNLLKELNSIQLYQNFLDKNIVSSQIKKIQFNQNYILSEDSNMDNVNDFGVYKRLFLNGVDIAGKDGELISSYNFTYKNPARLPQKQSFNIDFWGYFKNGDNIAVFPEVYFYNNNSQNNFDRNVYSIYKRVQNDSGVKINTALGSANNSVFFRDRTPAFDDVSSGILTEIENLGSTTKFVYEPNYFDYYGNKREGPGLRVSKIIKIDNNKEYTKEFFYGNDDNGKGYINLPVQYAYRSVPGNSANMWWPEFNHLIRSVGSLGNRISYDVIRTVNSHGQLNNGSTVNKYSYYNPYYNPGITIGNFNYVSPTFDSSYFIRHQQLNSNAYFYDTTNYITIAEENLDKLNGHLVNQKIFDSNNNLLKEINNDYSLTFNSIPSFSADYEGGTYYNNYLLKYNLKKETNEEKFGNKNIKTETVYSRNQEGKIQEINISGPSYNNKSVIKYLYEEDSSTGSIVKSQNRLNDVSVITRYSGNELLEVQNRKYLDFSFPIMIFNANGTDILYKDMYDFQFEEKSFDGINFSHNQEIVEYGFYGNVKETKINDVYESTIFGYNHTLPIATVTGSRSNPLIAASQSIIAASDNSLSSYNENSLQSELDNFRKNTAHTDFLIKTSVYQPLIGEKISTSSDGSKIFKEYDGANRIKKFLDKDLNIIKEFNYNYVNSERHYNLKQEQTFTRSNCGRLDDAGSYNYIVPAKAYSSKISEAEANQKAVEEISLMGQYSADNFGMCTRKPFNCTINTHSSVADNSSAFFNKINDQIGNKFRGTICFNTKTINWSAIGTNIKVGTINGICRPLTMKSYMNGIDWVLTIYANGDVYARWSNVFSNISQNKTVIINFEFPYDL